MGSKEVIVRSGEGFKMRNFSLPNKFRLIKSGKLRWTQYVAESGHKPTGRNYFEIKF